MSWPFRAFSELAASSTAAAKDPVFGRWYTTGVISEERVARKEYERLFASVISSVCCCYVQYNAV